MASKNKKPINIFIIEDDELQASIFQKRLIKVFQFNDYSNIITEIFADKKSALQALDNKDKPDIIILDYQLPDGNGMEVLRAIREKDSNTPVIFVSAQKDVKVAIDLIKAGANEYILKTETNLFDKLFDACFKILDGKKITF